MKKLSLIATLLLAVLLLQECKKDTITATATSNTLLFAVINDTTWDADTINATLTYNSAANNKVLSFIATGKNRELNMVVTQKKSVNTTGFPLSSFTADSAATNTFSYSLLQKNQSGNYVYQPQGTVQPGSGTLIVTAIDSVKKEITGTFSFTALQNNYDTSGNIVSVTVSQISAGAFNKMPYTFKSN
jgi:hypothetical protein